MKKVFLWFLRGIVFFLLFGLAIKNSTLVDLRFFFDTTWQAPLSVVVLAVFAAGAAVGLSLRLAGLLREREGKAGR